MKFISTKLCIALFLAMLSAFTFAESSHQFSVNLSRDWVNYLQGDATFSNLNAIAYFTPVNKSEALPYSRTAFYSRVSSVSASIFTANWHDLNSVVAGRVLKKREFKNYSVNTFLAHKNLPIWTQLNYRYLDKDSWHFSDGTHSDSETTSVKEIALGIYLLDDFSIHGFFSKLDDNTYGIGLSKLFYIGNFGFIETNLSYAITDREKIETNIINNVVRNLDISARSEKNSYARISYYPIPQTRLSIAYQQIDYDQSDWKDSYSHASIQHYFTKMFYASLSYTHKETYFTDYFGNYNDIGLSLGFDF